MEKEFVPYELAVKLKELGFNEPCLASYVTGEYLGDYILNKLEIWNDDDVYLTESSINAPLWQQAYKFISDLNNDIPYNEVLSIIKSKGILDREEILPYLFCSKMIFELKNNNHKGCWESYAIESNREDILNELHYHLNKLYKSVEDSNDCKSIELSSDIGNLSMFMFYTYLNK